MEKPIKFRLHIISPVHIGCDDVYEPTGFVIDEKKQKLIEFDPLEFIKSLSAQDRKKFADICVQGNITSIVNIYKFISNRQIQGREVDIAGELISHYKKIRDLPPNNESRIKQELNQFTISRTAYNPYNNLPYIPGSSLKGSLRTAYLSKLAKDKGIKGRKDRAKDLEIELLQGSFATDPFRMVKVSDFLPVGDVKTKIVYAVNKKKKTSEFEARGPFQILETIGEGAVFAGVINIQQPEQKAEIKKPIQPKELLKSINDFYITAVNEENKVTKEIGAGSIVSQRITDKFKDRIGKTAFLLRIGRHSGAEAVTVEGNRNIEIMQGKGKYLDHATTIWLASETSKPTSNKGLLPFGWALLEIIPFDIKNIYPASVVIIEPTITKTEEVVIKKEAITVSKTIQAQTILWENATLTWSPGNQMLKATKDNLKAELKVSDKSIVPAEHHDKVFVKRKSVTANVTVEKIGNEFKIINIS